MKNYFLILIFTLITSFGFAQKLNQYDANGQRHGVWKKNFEGTKVLRYQGEFNHGKEIGTFKFYKNLNGQSSLTATKIFKAESDIAVVKFYSSTKNLISQGQMRGKTYVGKWLYYHNKSKQVMTEELYNNKGELEGDKKTYYLSGKIADIVKYQSGKINGVAQSFAESGILISSFQYKNNALHGQAKIYDTKGNIKKEGVYQNDRRHGIWRFYEHGKLVKEKDFTRRSKNPYKKK